MGRRPSAGVDRRPGSGGQRRQPDWPGFHRRPVRRCVVCGNAPGWPGELTDRRRRRRRPDAQRHPGGGRGAVRAAGECADAGGAINLCAVAARRVAAGGRRRASDRGAGRIWLALCARHDSSRRWPSAQAAAEIRPRGHRDRAGRSPRGSTAGLLPPQPAEHLHRQTDPRDARRHLREGERDGGTIQVSADVDPTMRLSVLDLVPVRTDQTTSDALAATVRLAQTADRLGYTRYWLAEHHNMPSVGATSPPVLIAYLAAQTTQLRLGSGGVMLPNHAPFVIAEQFAALEAAAPGRIDLGIGRAPGSDPVITALLRSTGHTSDVDAFPNHVQDIEALLGEDGAALRLATGEQYVVRATPAAAGHPDVWLLGS